MSTLLNSFRKKSIMATVDSLDTACILGNLCVIGDFIKEDPDCVNRRDLKLGWTPLYRSVVSAHAKAVQLLLEKGAQPDITSDSGETPLHLAVEKGNYLIAKFLLKFRANPDVQDEDGDTPMHYAVRNQDVHMVELLLKYRADPNIANFGGKKTALHLAVEALDEICVILLLNRGGDPYFIDANSRNCLELETTERIKSLLENSSCESSSDTSLDLGSLPGETYLRISEVQLQNGKFYY